MPELDINGKKIELNDDGFMQNPAEWDEEIAKALAKAEEGIEDMSKDHWIVVNYIREYYEKQELPEATEAEEPAA